MHPQNALAKTLDQVRAVIRRKHYSLNTEKTYCGWIERYARYVSRVPHELTSEQKMGAFTLFCIVYTHLLGIMFCMDSNNCYNAHDEVPSLRENDQRRETVRRQNVASESGGGAGECQKGRMAEGQATQTADDTKTILQGLGISPALADAPTRARDCFTARTRDECILDFVRRIQILPSGCWVWTGARQAWGHGQFRFMGCLEKTHRLALKLKMGVALVAGDFICHHCDNPPCVNPAHLYIGTHDTNMMDKRIRGRAAKITGENSVHATLTQIQVNEIRAKYKPFVYTINMLAAEYGLCATSIKNILSRKTWKA